jgi:glycerate kinase
MMIEKFKEKNIVIPNICSCGQLQKKLDKLIENKNVSVYSIINSECANNCIYYNKTQEYHKALSDIISSVKNVKFENFNN